MRNRRFLTSLLALSGAALSAQAPVDRSWRSLGMGGAGVAVADDLDAVHLNPAGLAQLGKVGTFKPLDALGYKRDRADFWILGVSADPSPEKLLDIDRYRTRYRSTIDSAGQDPVVLVKNQRMLDDLYAFDRLPIPMTVSVDMGGAVRNWGGAVWSRDEATLLLDHGAVSPKAVLRATSMVAAEAATAQAFLDDRLALGFGYRVVAQSKETRQYDIADLTDEGADAAVNLLRSTSSNLTRTEDWGHGFDLGFLWFQTPGLRWGGSIRDVGMKLDGEFVTPNLTLGLAWAPKSLQNNRRWTRRVNLGFALEDILYDTLGYKPLSKIDAGLEVSQTLVPYVLSAGVSAGIKGGYPTLLVSTTLFRSIRSEVLTYADETGYFTGDRENRVWMARVGVGL